MSSKSSLAPVAKNDSVAEKLKLNPINFNTPKGEFVYLWNFKIADNLVYNLEILNQLITDYNLGAKLVYAKPVSIIATSIIEAIMVDFLYRLRTGTNHFPVCLKKQELDLKQKLNTLTKSKKIEGFLGEEVDYKTLKNFNFSEVIQLFKEFSLLSENFKIYESLERLSYLRNRVHITNYFNNFERDEHEVFSHERVQGILNLLSYVHSYFIDHYHRPWK